LRSKGATVETFEIDNIPIEIGSDADLAIPVIVDETLHPTGKAEIPDQGGSADDIAAMIDLAIDNAVAPEHDASAPQGRDRRGYVRTLGDDDKGSLDPGKTERLGRIAIKRVAVSAIAPTMEVAVIDPPTVIPSGRPTTFSEATRAIKRGPHRDRVAELVVETLEEFVPACDAALILVIRGTVAIGWKHFARGRDSAPEVAVPLDQPGIVPAVIAKQQLGRCGADDLGPIDLLLMRELGGFDGELVVAPVMIGSRVMCLVAAAMQKGADTGAVDAVATAAGAAFARLIRDASR
jgi:hypothetical protein